MRISGTAPHLGIAGMAGAPGSIAPPSLPIPAPASAPDSASEQARAREAGGRAGGSPTASLWELLTPEERAFFEDQAALGPLTYRPGGPRRDAASPSAPTGQRIDVRG